jgi:iron complex transport system substrate-binding protein
VVTHGAGCRREHGFGAGLGRVLGLPRLRLDAAALSSLRSLLSLLLLAGMLWAAPPNSSAQPIRLVDDRGRTVTLAAPARRIVSLLPSLTETLCELQACDRLVGIDRFSNWPERVHTLPKLGGLEDTQIERLVALQPDLVVAALSARAIDRLEALGLTVLALEPRDLAQTRRAIVTLAQAIGRPEAGAALAERVEQRIAAAAARVPPAWRGRKVYLEVASTPHAAGEASFAGELLARLGLGNIVPAALGPFPQLNPEFVLRAQPDLVIATAAAVAEMPRRPGWAALAALRDGRACGLEPAPWDTLVRPGPRLAEAAEVVADCLAGRMPW